MYFEEFLVTYANTIGIVGEVEISNSKVSFNNGLSKESFKRISLCPTNALFINKEGKIEVNSQY